MHLLWGMLFLAGIYPLGRAWWANRHTTLRQPLVWALLAWAAWTTSAWLSVLGPERDSALPRYLALCLTGCAGVDVLGARRPGAAAWNFVVVGLLAVLLLPVLNGMGEPRLEAAHWLFLSITLAVPILNYLPTRLGLSAILVAIGCGCELAGLVGEASRSVQFLGMQLVALCPWASVVFLHSGQDGSEFDRLWRSYRDRFGFVWGQRMREQFNRAAHHAGWPVVLRWGGLSRIGSDASPDPAALLATLRAVLKRFGPEEETN